MVKTGSRRLQIGLLILGVLLFIFGLVSVLISDDLIRRLIQKELALKNGSYSMDQWKHLTSPAYMDFYVFNITNAPEVLAGKKPVVVELGPYSYREDTWNEPLSWSDDGGEVFYRQTQYFYFDTQKSCRTCFESDIITTFSIPLMTLVNSTKDRGIFVKAAISGLVAKAKGEPIHRLSIKELLWGYNDSFLINVNNFLDKFPILKPFFSKVNPFIALQYNGTVASPGDNLYSVRTGNGPANDVLTITSWRNKRRLSAWINVGSNNNSDYGNMINGTDGKRFPPNVESAELYIFVQELCRSIYLNKQEGEFYVRGISTLRYETEESIFLNATANPDNKPFCVPTCKPSGILSMSTCIPNEVPVYISSPHFYLGDPSFVDAIVGLHPSEASHSSYIDIEPTSGLVLNARKQLQVNVQVQKADFGFMNNIQDMVFPVMYADENGAASEEDSKSVFRMVILPVQIVKVGQFVMLALGVLLVVTMGILQMVYRKPTEETVPIIREEI